MHLLAGASNISNKIINDEISLEKDRAISNDTYGLSTVGTLYSFPKQLLIFVIKYRLN